MNKRICFLYTETTGLHQSNYPVSKKKLYTFARMVSLNYIIGYLEDNKFVQEKIVRKIVKPRCMYIPEETIEYHGITQDIAKSQGIDPEVLILELKEVLKTVDVVVSHNVDFHVKTVQAEAVKYNISLDFSNFIIVDTINFYHSYGFIKLKELALKLALKNIPETNDNNVELIKNVFLKLYGKFQKSVANAS
jgi:DNA polymerase III epsilon subunit-like protein